jgi:hypothetical protein
MQPLGKRSNKTFMFPHRRSDAEAQLAEELRPSVNLE